MVPTKVEHLSVPHSGGSKQGLLTEWGGFSTIDLLVKTSLDQQLFTMLTLYLITKQATLMWGPKMKGGRFSTVVLLVLTSLDKLLLILKTLFTFLQNKLP